jgi:hypothetical protein
VTKVGDAYPTNVEITVVLIRIQGQKTLISFVVRLLVFFLLITDVLFVFLFVCFVLFCFFYLGG